MLKTKSIHELRVIAQTFGVTDTLSKDSQQLIDAIEQKQRGMVKEPKAVPLRPEYDARLMTKPPSKKSTESDIRDLLKDHIRVGLHLEFTDQETWAMSHGNKNDTGSVRMPLRVILKCADKVME